VTIKNIIVFALLGTAAIGTWYLASQLTREPPANDNAPAQNLGFYLRSARILGTGDNGELLYEIEAEYAEQQDSSTIELEDVRISYSPEADVPWVIEADVAVIDSDLPTLSLRGHVVAVSEKGFAGKATEIRTPELNIDPNAYQAETDARVQIRIGSRSLTSTGMLALLQDNRLQLKSNVSGKFVP